MGPVNGRIAPSVSGESKRNPAKGVPATLPIGVASSGELSSPQRSVLPGLASRIILTTYPGQSGIDPIPINWGHVDPHQRGPVVVSRSQNTIRRRNVASKNLDVDHKPNFTNSEPAVSLGPFPQWAGVTKIVSLDPLGHLSPWLFDSIISDENVHIRPTIAITKAHMKLPELEQSVRAGRLIPDGKICLNATGELAVTKFAVEPVWFLPGVAERFGIGEQLYFQSQPQWSTSLTEVHQMRVLYADPFSRTLADLFQSLSPVEI
ncbi:MAG: hypothetical protein Q9186_005605 [Xanthomendoza sp. 1 TL-2023]